MTHRRLRIRPQKVAKRKFNRLLSMKPTHFILIQLFLLSQISLIWPQSNLSLGDRYAIIVGGIGGREEYTEKYFSQTSRLYDFLVNKLGYERNNVVYLFEDTSFDSLNIDYTATAANVRRAFYRVAQTMQKDDQLLVFLVGHGTFDGRWSKFNLVGPDLRDIDFGRLLSELPTKKIILINTASTSGAFIERLSAEERVIITATKSGGQHYETNFADFFLDALSSEEADSNKDTRISMLEAFNFARASQDKWFEEKRRIRAEHPLLDDNGDGKGSQKLGAVGDGLLASRVYLNPISTELQSSLQHARSGMQSAVDSLLLRRVTLEAQIQELKARKPQMKAEEYGNELETLLVQLAKVSRELRKRESEN